MKFYNNDNELKQSIMNIALSSLSSHIFEYYTFANEILIENHNTINLFNNPRRFDLFAKYIYIFYKDKKIKSEWGNTIYREHIKAFNNFFEDDDSGKAGSEMYINAFDKLILPYEKNANFKPFYLIPLDENNCPLDASHRLALSAYYKHSVSFIKMKKLEPHNSYVFDYKFFINKGLEPKYSDFIALEYSKNNPNTYLLCVFPKVETSPLFDNIICEHADIYYQKNVYLTKTGQLNLMRYLYKDEDWLGDFDNEFAGAQYKIDMCFNSSSKALKVYLIVAESLDKVIQLKSELRNLFDSGKHSLHINDFHEQTVRLARTLFNSKSIDYINNVPPKHLNNFSSYLILFSKWIEKNSLNIDNFCVSGSAVLSAFGMRDCYDLDFLAVDRQIDKHFSDTSKVSCHNEHFLSYIDKPIDDIVFNPENHFYVDNIKFLSLDLLKIFKLARGESKDDKDVELINNFLSTCLYQHKLKCKDSGQWLTRNQNRLKC
jgi:hypothetical protein